MSKYAYRNENTGDVVEYDYPSARLEMLPNWDTLEAPEAAVEPQDPGSGAQEPQEQGGEGTPPIEPPGGGSGEGDGPGVVERPARSANKAEWQEYARSLAQDSDEAAAVEGLTKDQIVEKYGSDD
ncbi:hypothetical protein [Streptomyces sp. NBC_00443]|uniref:hypothetical protein n=1 Tax=Streptomyces sp. NBC_00443 TaxID=2975743 RepID=UPI002E224DC9